MSGNVRGWRGMGGNVKEEESSEEECEGRGEE